MASSRGAYQEILGDLHNLSHTNAVHVSLDERQRRARRVIRVSGEGVLDTSSSAPPSLAQAA